MIGNKLEIAAARPQFSAGGRQKGGYSSEVCLRGSGHPACRTLPHKRFGSALAVSDDFFVAYKQRSRSASEQEENTNYRV
jgi:hypothetical protein